MAVGEVSHLLGRQTQAPGVRWRDNAVQFTDNPFGGAGAITIGNTTTYNDDPDTAAGRKAWAHGEDWWGEHNWNEQGPKANPPTPWLQPGKK